MPNFETREEAALYVLQILSYPLALMSVPTRELTVEICRKWSLTAEDLLMAAYRKVRNT